jgi:hypothetical protein
MLDRKPSAPAGDVVEAQAALEKSLRDKKVSFSDLLRTKYWQSFEGRKAKVWRELGSRYYYQLLAAFYEANGPEAEVGVYGESGLGAYKTKSEFKYVIIGRALRFDWSEGQALILRINDIAERACEWWGPTADGEAKGNARAATAERQRFLDRALGYITAAYAAIDQENPPPGAVAPSERSDTYRKRIQALAARLDIEERNLDDALQRSAQIYYGRGMFYGALAAAGVSAALGAAFWLAEVDALNGVAFTAGAAGAVVSVLQRMSSNRPKARLTLDFNAGQKMLGYYGAVRPFIGGLLGYMIFVFLEGGLLPAFAVTTTAPLATFAGLGFLGGFNERWAQDMITGSAKRLEQDSSS